ncbi:MAG TPA: ACP phosphodiesterase [Thermoanaerobaculia bacterium]|nr:ACP phosphodiesterase [Thermoanaerobaculia bacterium]
MNYLAHLFLARPTPESLLGNLAGDFVKGPLGDRFPPAIADGIRQHRRIDAFTDAHPQVAAFRRVLIPEHGHYARVIADVFFDHFLAVDFERWSPEPLPSFVARVSAILDAQLDAMPPRLRTVWPRMRDQQWLLSYVDVDSIGMALFGISRRLTRHPDLARAARHLENETRPELERLFRAFFPDAIAFMKDE